MHVAATHPQTQLGHQGRRIRVCWVLFSRTGVDGLGHQGRRMKTHAEKLVKLELFPHRNRFSHQIPSLPNGTCVKSKAKAIAAGGGAGARADVETAFLECRVGHGDQMTC